MHPAIPAAIVAMLSVTILTACETSAPAVSATAVSSAPVVLTEDAAAHMEGRYTGQWRGPRPGGPRLTLDITDVDLAAGTVTGVYGWQYTGQEPDSTDFTAPIGTGSFRWGDDPTITFYFDESGTVTRGSWVHRRWGTWDVTPRRQSSGAAGG